MKLNINTFGGLFEVQTRGAIATAFISGAVEPSLKHWAMINGTTEPTMRDISDIAHITGFKVNLELVRNADLETPST